MKESTDFFYTGVLGPLYPWSSLLDVHFSFLNLNFDYYITFPIGRYSLALTMESF